ncbi:hypothetical protein L202_07232 [Cryptococcus amylolentus CBS 6039]|uniref:Ricin B lectin domain-containing protein n=2 Tax=Cryptococcus amylolentus TaxID=104669 RepID=A0A1E3HD62_9TREE|nr:hypothetical protein L202_07232 [Cryptococcus amylolentus CBS 6039]ODN73686.1 hypothetical protein L202_07232 [Cryptococcus amylolentus CBS 6039]ODO00421.1 hypothetical protein I350_07061 [Cryptococcus amylolentus CBS 6273]
MLAIFALLPLLALASASPIQKRYSGVKIKSGLGDHCLTPLFGQFQEGTPITTAGCADAKTWDINPGSGSVLLHGTEFAMDAGTGTDNHEIVKLWTSYPGLFQQTWFYTDDNRIAITGGNQCLDETSAGPQTYECTPWNDNQVWHIVEVDTPTSSVTSSITPLPTGSASVSDNGTVTTF